MGSPSAAQADATSHQLLSVSTPPAHSKRSRSQESHRSGSARLITPSANGDGQNPNTAALLSNVKIPAFLNQQPAQISKRFQDLEWRQRFRLQHAYANPEKSPYRIDKSDTVANRNRYGNVQPWDPSRVKLKTPIGGSDYINASPISLPSDISTPSTKPESTAYSTPDNSPSAIKLSEMRYIATQGPKDDQFVHFWHMVMQETVGPVAVIVMLTQCYEGIKEKCSQYFPKDFESPVLVLDGGELATAEVELGNGDPFVSPQAVGPGADILTTEPSLTDEVTEADGPQEPGKPREAVDDPGSGPPREFREDMSIARPPSGSVTLLSLGEDPQSRSEIRRMRLELDGETKEIYHYLFNGWPDYGKPEGDDRRALLELTRQTRERAQAGGVGGSGNPRVVHCSAGVGRTGTFIALDWLLSQLEEGNLLPKPLSEQENGTAYVGNSNVNGGGTAETRGKSGPVKEKEATPEDTDGFDLIYETVNKLREQRMMMVTNEIQYFFLYEILKEAFVEKYSRTPVVGVGVLDVDKDEDVSAKSAAASDSDGDSDGATPGSQHDDPLSEAETEIEGDPYQAVAPPDIREEIKGAHGVGAE